MRGRAAGNLTVVPDDDTVDAIADLAGRHWLKVAVAESLTSGHVSTALGRGGGAAEWFRGGLVAYSPTAKSLLGVPDGPVITAECAAQMAIGARQLFEADVAVGVTGVGGPDDEEGKPPGSVFVAAASPTELRMAALHLHGEPAEILDETVDRALRLLLECLRDHVATGATVPTAS